MPPETLPGLLERTARRHPNGPALAGLREEGVRWSLSWEGLVTRIRAGAGRLREAGVEPGDRVATWLPAGPRRTAAALAVQALGAAEVPLAPDLPGDQARTVLEAAGVDAALVEEGARRRRAAAAEAGLGRLLDPGELPALDAPVDPPESSLPDPDPEAAAWVLPAGWGAETRVVPVEAREAAAGARAASEALPLDRRDRVLQAAPPTHVPARLAGTLAPLAAGASVAFPPGEPGPPGRRAGGGLLEAARERGATALACTADGVGDLWRSLGETDPELEVVLAAGDPPPAPAREGLAEAGLDVVEVHGPAETGPVVATGPRQGGRLAPTPGLEARPGEEELVVRGPGVPAGAADGDGWMATGWGGEVDGQGRVEPAGRADDALPGDDGPRYAEAVEAALRGAAPGVARAVAVEVDGAAAAVVPDGAVVPGGSEGKALEAVAEAAREADPGPDRVAVLEAPPSGEDGLRDHGGEVRRGACARAWEGSLDWRDLEA